MEEKQKISKTSIFQIINRYRKILNLNGLKI